MCIFQLGSVPHWIAHFQKVFGKIVSTERNLPQSILKQNTNFGTTIGKNEIIVDIQTPFPTTFFRNQN
ncbi:unnamed protein product [Citrullus colocynthis]|uniref:Uncharacterized protein n=1 Tax=Citrullus colocynthis TaxID=252529 RepID=A0ABP0YN92_9ROSI